MNDLSDVIERLEKAKKRWLTESVDDPEEMWVEYQEFIEFSLPILIKLQYEK